MKRTLVVVVALLCVGGADSVQAQTKRGDGPEKRQVTVGSGFMGRFGRGLLLEKIRTGSPQDQAAAARELGRRRDRNAVPALVELLEGAQVSPSGSPSEAIVQALGEIEDRRAVPVLLGLLNARGPLQRAAIRALGRIGDERALDPIANVLSRPSLTRDAIAALLQLGPRVLMRVVSLLRDPSTAGPACELLGRLGDRRATWPMVHALDSPRARVRRQCAAGLGELGDPRAQRALYRLLQDSDASVRRRALASLVVVADGSMGPMLAPLIGDQERGLDVLPALRGTAAKAAVPTLTRVATTSIGEDQEHAIVALGRIGGPDAAQVMATLLKSSRSDVRFLASTNLARLERDHALEPLLHAARSEGPQRVDGLRGLADLYRPVPMLDEQRSAPEEVRALVSAALSDPAPETAGAGAFLAGALRDRDALDELVALSQRPSRPDLRSLAVSALAWLSTSKSCPAITAAIADANEGVRATASWSAGELGCKQAGPALLAVLERGPDGAAGNAAWALGAVSYRPAIETLRQRLEEGGPALRANSALALAALDDTRSSALIRRRLGRERSPRVKAALIDALGQLGEPSSLSLLERLSSLPGGAGRLARDAHAAIDAGQRLRSARGSATFRTRIVDREGAPLANLWFTAALPDRRMMGGLTDPSGEVTLFDLPSGAVVLGLGRTP